jgi:hypothetical protein
MASNGYMDCQNCNSGLAFAACSAGSGETGHHAKRHRVPGCRHHHRNCWRGRPLLPIFPLSSPRASNLPSTRSPRTRLASACRRPCWRAPTKCSNSVATTGRNQVFGPKQTSSRPTSRVLEIGVGSRQGRDSASTGSRLPGDIRRTQIKQVSARPRRRDPTGGWHARHRYSRRHDHRWHRQAGI